MKLTFVARIPLVAALALAVCSFIPKLAAARPNTHAPAVSTWDARASSVVAGLGSAVSGEGSFSFTSYNANFSSTNGVLSAQFGVHYMTFKSARDAVVARGVSAGGVALISLPLASRFENGVPKSSFAFYIGGVPTAMFSGQLNFISVPLVLGIGLPLSPSPYVTFRPWVELSPGLNFDTRIDAISTSAAVQAAMDGTLTRDEVEDLVEEGLNIERETTVGKRAGMSLAVHLGERVDIDGNLMIGAGRPGALSLGAALVFRWDAMVHNLDNADRRGGEPESCLEIAARYHRQCPLRRDPGRATPRSRSAPDPRRRPQPSAPGAVRPQAPYRAPPPRTAPRAAPPAGSPAPGATPAPAPAPASPSGTSPAKKPASNTTPAPSTPSAPVTRPKPGELPPLQAAPPRTP